MRLIQFPDEHDIWRVGVIGCGRVTGSTQLESLRVNAPSITSPVPAGGRPLRKVFLAEGE